ncbi:MAG: hypothetical protein JRJ79_16935 [Deltaproteobacteria bacterium]|nr:hypothetical protein [Deltaproteobacteria bacterium]
MKTDEETIRKRREKFKDFFDLLYSDDFYYRWQEGESIYDILFVPMLEGVDVNVDLERAVKRFSEIYKKAREWIDHIEEYQRKEGKKLYYDVKEHSHYSEVFPRSDHIDEIYSELKEETSKFVAKAAFFAIHLTEEKAINYKFPLDSKSAPENPAYEYYRLFKNFSNVPFS